MQRRTVLVVEDDPQMRTEVRDLLEGSGLSVVAARNGAEADALVELAHPAAILLDLMMPVTGGWDLLQRLRSQGIDQVPVILFSGSADLETEAVRMGLQRYLRKPCKPERLVAEVWAALGAA